MIEMKPKWLVNVHHLHAVLVSLLLLSGLILFIQPLRTQFNELKIPLVAIHIWIAVFYIILVSFSLKGAWKYFHRKPLLKTFNVKFNIILFTAWLISGIVMYFQTFFSVTVRNLSVMIHDYSTWIAIPWILVHSIGHALKAEMPWPLWWKRIAKRPEWVEVNQLERRDFTKSVIMMQ